EGHSEAGGDKQTEAVIRVFIEADELETARIMTGRHRIDRQLQQTGRQSIHVVGTHFRDTSARVQAEKPTTTIGIVEHLRVELEIKSCLTPGSLQIIEMRVVEIGNRVHGRIERNERLKAAGG